MVKVGEMFPGKYLRAEDLGQAQVVVRIRAVTPERVGDDQLYVCYFVGKDKGLVLKQTNAHSLQEIAGSDESDEWIGVTVCLYATTVEYRGKNVPCLRIKRAPSGVAAPLPPPQRISDTCDDVPF